MKIDLRGLKDLENRLKTMSAQLQDEIAQEVKASAYDTLRIAKQLAPVDKGSLRQNTTIEQTGKYEYKIGNEKDYAPYIEFGTGIRTIIPPELSEFASQFKGATGEKWEDGLKEIEKWCKRKGIPVELAYPIWITILNDGIEPQPFLYPAFKLGRKVLQTRIKRLIDG